jgi:putative membrane protein
VRRFDEAMTSRIEAAVAAAEERSTLEIVVRVVPRSAPYRDVHWALAAVAGFGVLAFLLFAPRDVDPNWVLPEVAVTGLLAAALPRWFPLERWLTRPKRRAASVLQAARACFMEQAISGTRDRTGVLVFASDLERLVLVLPDFGAQAAAPQAAWDAVSKLGRGGAGGLPQRVLQVLAGVEALGAAYCEADPGDNPDELPNRPLIG